MSKLLPLLLLFYINTYAQDTEIFKPDSVRKKIEAIKIYNSIRVDGLLNEPEWSLAKPSAPFIEIEPYQGKAADFATSVKVLYNKEYLYIGVFAQDSLGKKAIRATDFKRDFDYYAHDLVNFSFDGFNDQRNAMSFATNAYGVQRDYLSFDDLYFDINWDGLWRVRTNRTDSGWYAEIAIPWKTLRYAKTKDSTQSWGMNIYRNRRLTNEITAFSPFPRAFSASRMNYAGLLTNLQPPPPTSNIRVQPYVLSSFNNYKNFDTTVKPHQPGIKAGGDIKWAINSNSVLDITANTDFAQADADIQVNSVSRFSVFFPEKRQFFLENASLFSPVIEQANDGSGGSMHIQPFFSRTIGLDSSGNPIPIIAGARFAHRSVKNNYGAIVMRQEGTDESPATNFFVGRYSRNFGRLNRIGFLSTIKNTTYGSNIATTLDGFFRLNDAQSINTILTQTNTTNTGKQGFAGFAEYINSTNHYKIWLTQSVVTKDFDPQMGFVSRTDVIGTTPGMNWYYRGKLLPLKKILRAFEPGVLPELYWQASTGKFIESSLYVYPLWFNFNSGAYLGYGIIPVYQDLTQPFEPLGVTIGPGKYTYLQNEILASTDPSKFIAAFTDYKWGSYYNGRIYSADYKLQFAPIPYIFLLGEFNRNHFINVGEQKVTSKIDLYILQARFAINPRIQLTGFYQLNSVDKSKNYYMRFSWEYQPLSYIYIIYNHNGFTSFQQVKQSEDHEIMKISYLKQF